MRTPVPSTPSDEVRLLIRVTALANRFASRLLDPDDAEDLAQQVVLECLARLRRGRWRVHTSLRGVVRSIVRRRWMRSLYAGSVRGAIDAQHLQDREDCTPVWMDPEAMLEMSEAETLRATALAELPEGCRTAYLLVREEGATYRDVAAELGISIGLVAHYMRNAERHLISRVLGRRMPLQSSLRVRHRAPARRRLETSEEPRRRVSSARHAGANGTTAGSTVKSARPRQIYAEKSANNARTTANVAEPTPTYEKASSTFG